MGPWEVRVAAGPRAENSSADRDSRKTRGEKRCWQSREVVTQEVRHLCNRATSKPGDRRPGNSVSLFCSTWRETGHRNDPSQRQPRFEGTLHTKESPSAPSPHFSLPPKCLKFYIRQIFVEYLLSARHCARRYD